MTGKVLPSADRRPTRIQGKECIRTIHNKLHTVVQEVIQSAQVRNLSKEKKEKDIFLINMCMKL